MDKNIKREEDISKIIDTDLFYVQHVRVYIDDMLFFIKGCNGYTRDIDKAHIFTGAEIKNRLWRCDDIIWHKEAIDASLIRIVNYDNLDKTNMI